MAAPERRFNMNTPLAVVFLANDLFVIFMYESSEHTVRSLGPPAWLHTLNHRMSVPSWVLLVL